MNHLRAVSPGRLGPGRHLIAFAIGFGVIAGVAVGVVALLTVNRSSLCQPAKPCGPPHQLHPLVNNTLWRSTQYGFSLEYPADLLSVIAQDARGVALTTSDGALVLRIRGWSGLSPSSAISSERSAIGSGINQLARDGDPADALLGSNVGYRPGPGDALTGTVASPQGSSTPVNVAIQAAASGSVTITATAVYANQSAVGNMQQRGEQQLADGVFNTIEWGP